MLDIQFHKSSHINILYFTSRSEASIIIRYLLKTIDGTVALDLDNLVAGWDLDITQLVVIRPSEMWKLLDGVIVY